MLPIIALHRRSAICCLGGSKVAGPRDDSGRPFCCNTGLTTSWLCIVDTASVRKPLLGLSRYMCCLLSGSGLTCLHEIARVVALCSTVDFAKSGKYLIIIHEPSVTEEQQRRAANITTGKKDGGMKGVRLPTLDCSRTPLASATRIIPYGQAHMTAGLVFLGSISGQPTRVSHI